MTGLAKSVVKSTAKETTHVYHVVAHGQNKTTRRLNDTMVTGVLYRTHRRTA